MKSILVILCFLSYSYVEVTDNVLKVLGSLVNYTATTEIETDGDYALSP
jgi:hypothetical protein